MESSTSKLGDNISDVEYTDDDEERNDNTKSSRKENSKLPSHLKGLMGEANLRYARGDLDTAKKMCFEVIRQAPDAYEPYLTLSQMYENVNMKKYKAYLMLASHLGPQNIAITCRLAELCLQDGDIDEAIKCYSRGIKHNPQSLFLHRKRLELLEKKGDEKNSLMAKQTMANNIKEKYSDIIIDSVMEVAKEHYKNKNYIRSIDVLRIPIRRIPDKVNHDIINVLLEVLLISGRYSDCLDIFTQFCGFVFDVTVTDENSIIINSYEIPDNLPLDLHIKFISCLVKLRSQHLFPELINKMLIDLDVEVFGDLYLDVVESLISVGYYEEALKLLVPLVKSKAYFAAAIWLKYAECLAHCNMTEQAIDAYFTVRYLAPSHIEVLYPLAMLLLKENKKDEALKVMSQDVEQNKLDVRVLLEKMKLLIQLKDWESYWKSVELLFSRHSIILKHDEELKLILTKDRYQEKVVRLKKMRKFRNDNTNVESNFEVIGELNRDEEYQIYKDILQLALDKKEYCYLQKFIFMGFVSRTFPRDCPDTNIIAAFACLLTNDTYHGFTILRELLIKHPCNNLVWNWFGLLTSTLEDVRFLKFLDRRSKEFVSENRKIVMANYNLSVGSYIATINYYLKSFKRSKSIFSSFMLAVSMLQYHCQRNLSKSMKKLMAESVSYLFLKYAKHRHPLAEQEVYYNLGRMYHQLGVMYLAEYYYNKVFKVDNEFLEKYPEIVCLKREAAFNLHVIYKSYGNLIAARDILYKYVII
ncbi:general transcription factor 3C polypeptide 3 [Diorhabda sublineata]|uniref:general transcription factor 3C polypeptide 3 n=1 Tax=Diorhabda sublineata TaxID=1163346 RepID=UPI0024E0F8CA|nr:general transcription factor 3C polypeptide 3 [Diorhabda sublineata]